MGYRSPRQLGPLVVINQWDNLISHYDHVNSILSVDVRYSLNCSYNTLKIIENSKDALIPNVKLKLNFTMPNYDKKPYYGPDSSLDDLRELISTFDDAILIDKQLILADIEKIIASNKELKIKKSRSRSFMRSENRVKPLDEILFKPDYDWSESYLSINSIFKESLEKFMLIKSFKSEWIPSVYSYNSKSMIFLMRLKENKERFYQFNEKLIYFYENLKDPEIKNAIESEFLEVLAFKTMKDLI